MSWIVLAALAAVSDADPAPEPAAPPAAQAPAEAPAEAQPSPEEPQPVALREPTPEEQKAKEHAQELVSGAPLYNPNVAVHIVQRKPFADRGLRELVLYPAVPQANGKFTQHFG